MIPVLALHGFPDGPATFAPLAPALAMAGFELVAPYLPGHDAATATSFRAARAGRSTLEAALEHLLELIERRFGSRPVHLLGHDWGAILGYALASHHAERFASFTALAIPPLTGPLALARRYPAGLWRFWYIALFQVPRLGERLIADPRFLDRLVTRWSPGWSMPADLRADLLSRYTEPSIAREVLAYYRALGREPATWRLLASPPRVPTLVLAGANDGCFPAAAFPSAVTQARQAGAAHLEGVILPGLGHWLHHEAPAQVLAQLLPWLKAPGHEGRARAPGPAPSR